MHTSHAHTHYTHITQTTYLHTHTHNTHLVMSIPTSKMSNNVEISNVTNTSTTYAIDPSHYILPYYPQGYVYIPVSSNMIVSFVCNKFRQRLSAELLVRVCWSIAFLIVAITNSWINLLSENPKSFTFC